MRGTRPTASPAPGHGATGRPARPPTRPSWAPTTCTRCRSWSHREPPSTTPLACRAAPPSTPAARGAHGAGVGVALCARVSHARSGAHLILVRRGGRVRHRRLGDHHVKVKVDGVVVVQLAHDGEQRGAQRVLPQLERPVGRPHDLADVLRVRQHGRLGAAQVVSATRTAGCAQPVWAPATAGTRPPPAVQLTGGPRC